MGSVVERLKSYLETEEGKKWIEEQQNKLLFENEIVKRNNEFIHSLSKEKRKEIVDRIISKYSSQEYRDKEYKLGYEPRCDLFFVLHDYANAYGQPWNLVPGEDPYGFVSSKVRFDDYIIILLCGQGTVCECYPITEEDIKAGPRK